MSSALEIVKSKTHFASSRCIYRLVEGVCSIPQTVEVKVAPRMVDIFGLVSGSSENVEQLRGRAAQHQENSAISVPAQRLNFDTRIHPNAFFWLKMSNSSVAFWLSKTCSELLGSINHNRIIELGWKLGWIRLGDTDFKSLEIKATCHNGEQLLISAQLTSKGNEKSNIWMKNLAFGPWTWRPRIHVHG